MLYTFPHYYKDFHCIAGACPDTCCAGWQIVIDDRTRASYRRMKGPFGNRLRNSIDWKESSFLQYDGRCAFLNEAGLCDIYGEAGKAYLCRTCRDYPRHIEEFEGCREISLSLSCPEAARLILGCREPVRFLTREREGTEEYEAFDFFLYTKLGDARDGILRILQDRNYPIGVRIGAVLALAHDLQRRIASGRLYEADAVLARYTGAGAMDRLMIRLKRYQADERTQMEQMQALFGLFGRLEVLKADWPAYVAERKALLYAAGPEAWSRQRRQCRSLAGEQWEIWLEQLMVYFVFTYFCGAVYDGNAYGKMKMAVVSTLLIGELAVGVWKQRTQQPQQAQQTQQTQGGSLGGPGLSDLGEAARRYSREVEHSDQNLAAVEAFTAQEPCCGLEALLMAVMSGTIEKATERNKT